MDISRTSDDDMTSLLSLVNAEYEQWRQRTGSSNPPGTESLDEIMYLGNLINQGDFESARSLALVIVERYPQDYQVQLFAISAFNVLGMYTEALQSIVIMLALRPDMAGIVFARAANTLSNTAAPNRATVLRNLRQYPNTRP